MILRNKLLIGGATVAGAIVALLLATQLTASYTADASLISDPSMAGIIDPERGETPTLVDPSTTTTIVETIGTSVVLGRAISALPPDLYERLIAEAGVRDEIAASSDPNAAALEKPLLIRYLSQNVSVYNSGRSYVILISYKSKDPQIAAAVSNAVAMAYLDYRTELKRSAYTQMLDNLGSEIATLRVELQSAEQSAQTAREKARLLALRSEALMGLQQETAITENSELYARQREAEREGEATAAAYEKLLRNQRELKSRLSSPDLNVQLFAPAVEPLRPSGFNAKPVLLVLGVAGGFFAGASLALLLEELRRRRLIRKKV